MSMVVVIRLSFAAHMQHMHAYGEHMRKHLKTCADANLTAGLGCIWAGALAVGVGAPHQQPTQSAFPEGLQRMFQPAVF